ncbi:molybdopterin cofactor-binding domain-containing protein [Alteraurantiacibacter aquimixticola]|uniref:Xanthine dehydrogenase family protein molybdopterin-binding subunit n=1 Tax=Alteraurantiacibacter aquimixticola TaxID=2489173 RepID=A0A4T3F289_9SPHN|nr:molybdopterin cofactor-binding domain-containing protein [Alteraurantiacibacter aquimixticola]TIX49525.1 xanthine dehydrogenase family protein molybdopterin-binding subunit [Alteraurantiacibacter aquimixticola]
MKLTRRNVLAGAAVGGGLLVAWSLLPRDYDSPLDPSEGETAFDAWLKIASDGVITVSVPQLEMGQGITTLLPQVMAMELGADWRQVAVEPAPVSGAYANLPLAARWAPLWRPAIPALADDADDFMVRRWAEGSRFTATADGMSMAAYEMPCRLAAASARAMLEMAAAERWGVDWEACDASDGFVTHGENRLTFGELALEAADFSPPDPPPLRPEPPRDPSFAAGADADDDSGEIAFPRLDLPSKIDGSFQFAGDVRLPDMVYAAIRHGPRDRSELIGFDVERAGGIRDMVGIVRGKRWLAAAATNWWAAEQALTVMNPRFAAENIVRSERIETALDNGVRRGAAQRIVERGQGDAAYTPDFALRYDIAPAIHATPETATVTARLLAGRLELWMASQAPEAARAAAAKAIGLSLGDVVLYPMPAGGSFDRRLEHEQAIEAALIARELGRPVQLVWSRAEEQLAAHPRPPAAALIGAQLTQEGRIAAMRVRVATPPAAKEFGCRLFDNKTSWSAIEEVAGEGDPMAVEGLDMPYAVPDLAVDHIPVKLPLPSGRMRANAHGMTCFMLESFIDEVAVRGGFEPVSFRIAMLGQDALLVDCLQRAARLSEWDGGARGTGQGIACHRMERGGARGRVAVVATAAAGEGGVRVSRIAAAVNIGRVVNRDIAMQQIEGGIVFGLSLALGSATGYDEGWPTAARLADLNLPTLADMPRISVELVESEEESFDPGEIGVPAVAPAIANALFSATGLRLRRLPLLSGGL